MPNSDLVRELLHTKKRQEDTYEQLKATIGDSLISWDIEMVGPEVTASQASSFLPSVINEDMFRLEMTERLPSGSLTSRSVSVTMDNSLSPSHTLVQIVCQDHKGLLYDIMRTLKDYNIQVYLVSLFLCFMCIKVDALILLLNPS